MAFAPPEAVDRKPSCARAWRLPVGVAAAVVTGLLLLDVHVEVGKIPASAVSGPAEIARPNAPTPGTAPAAAERPPSAPELQVRRFAWAPTPRASRYRVEIFAGSNRVFAGETIRPQISVPKKWRHGGATRSLVPGEYRWYVWPVVSGRRASRAVVQASLTIPAR